MNSNQVSDSAIVTELLEETHRNEALLNLTGDDEYASQSVYEAFIQKCAISVILPRKNA